MRAPNLDEAIMLDGPATRCLAETGGLFRRTHVVCSSRLTSDWIRSLFSILTKLPYRSDHQRFQPSFCCCKIRWGHCSIVVAHRRSERL